MLPFLKKRKQDAGIAMEYRKPDDEESVDGLEVAMKDLCDAEEKKDYKAMAAAFRAAFEMLEVQPHEEAPHDEEQE